MGSGVAVVVIRTLMACVLAALGIVSLTNGHVVVGVLLLILAALNVAMTITRQRRRRRWRARIETRRAERGLLPPTSR